MDRYPKRIVCLTEETTETLYLLGAQDRIVGISGFTQRPPQARREKPIVSAFTSADIAKIEAQSPDLVLAFSDLQADLVRDLIARGHQVLAWNQRSLEEILNMIVVLGAIVGKSREGLELAGRLERELDSVRAKGAALPRRPKVYFEEWPDPMISGIRWVSELIEVAGGEDVFSELQTGGLARERIVTPEQVIERDPELIVASWCGKMLKPERILSRPGFENIRAVRAQRIHEIKSTLILQPGPASLTDGLRELHQHIAAAAHDND
ncbi:MAG TPA: cobalamin-binding protein [Polyangiales bacterium]|nr:cobalamin-binding protein [Polyangiales bacterium]